jgi:hypothetical protein
MVAGLMVMSFFLISPVIPKAVQATMKDICSRMRGARSLLAQEAEIFPDSFEGGDDRGAADGVARSFFS